MIGYIYKITNILNNKVYIGQTKQHYLDRFIQHKSHARTGQSNHKFARALRKYGDNNFIIEVLEECAFEQLDDRERYWIQYYNSTDDQYGYNINVGGQDYSRYYEVKNQDDIIQYYLECHNQQETIKKFNITEYKFRQLLLKENIPTDFTNYGKHNRQKVIIYELNQCFDSERDCAQFLIDNHYTSAKLQSVIVRINNAIVNKNKIYNLSILKEGDTIEDFNKVYFEHIRNTKGKKLVYQLDKDTKQIITIFDSAANASKSIGHSILDAVKGRYKGSHLSNNFLWYYEDEYNKIIGGQV